MLICLCSTALFCCVINKSLPEARGLKNRTRKALGLRKKDKDAETTSSPDKEATGSGKKGNKKANGAPNGFYGEFDWDRYASPDVDEEGFSLRPGDEGDAASKGKHFFSSSDSEDDEESRKKFKIKIKPLVAESAKCVPPSVDELKASVGGLSLSPSLVSGPLKNTLQLFNEGHLKTSAFVFLAFFCILFFFVISCHLVEEKSGLFSLPFCWSQRRSPGQIKRNLSCEEIARPRRSTPTPSPAPETPSDRLPQNIPAFFGLPSETQYIPRYDVVPADVWGGSRPRSESPLSRSFPTGAPPPLPPKNVLSRSQGYPSQSFADLPNGRATRNSAPIYLNVLSPSSYRGSPAPDLDDVFGPVGSPHAGSEDTMSSRWVTFTNDRPPPPDEPAPPPPPDSPAPDTPSSTPSTPCLSPGPPPNEPPPSPPVFSPGSPPPFTPLDSPPSIMLGPPPPDEPAPPLPPDFSPSSSPAVCLDEDSIDEEVLQFAHYSSSPAPISPVPPLPAERRSPRAGGISPLALGAVGGKRTPEGVHLRDDVPDFTGSPRELTPSFRGTPPPLPPTTYRSIMSSPGPYSGSCPSSPARSATPQSRGSPVPPLPPPRPSSRPKLPPGKPIADLTRPFSPPVSGSPPPFAPLARAESSSSISSITSQSAASTPTLGRDLNLSGCSRGPSPLTMGPQDTLPVAAAFTETINAYFKGADPSKCVVKITGEMVLSFPAGITRHFANHPTQPILIFSISNYTRLEQVLPNPQLLCCDSPTDNVDSKEFWVNMPNLMSHLKKVAEQKPQATYYNVDMIKYQVSADGIQSTPLNLAVSWRGDADNTDLRIDYKYNTEAMATPVPLHNVHFLVPVDGGLAKLQAMVPPATWNPEQQTIQWKIPSLSNRSENGGVGALLGRFQMTAGPSKPSQLAVHFTSEGSTLSGCDIQLLGTGYRLSLIKKRFAAGKYLADN
ncbi:SH3-containing GRB2-like protein 3-interacting protein 1 isoform X2 [Dunckerocampus dactyliophorus]|uniref:SH3-containing GRB2-like protein 3-interacting protein 1 isoform X2 n=1 Tax=Dunckerocampus dactyliophorus TaxID=161453 RepID=UPI002407284C|nr:SH3-containing GRB2-like protein 3-interacting protein 1 isoform X2 [Dunckerocampus dactyliophorus]